MSVLEPNSPLHHQVKVVKPAKGHEHMLGWIGRVVDVAPSIRRGFPAEWRVRFIGGAAYFRESELEIVD